MGNAVFHHELLNVLLLCCLMASTKAYSIG